MNDAERDAELKAWREGGYDAMQKDLDEHKAAGTLRTVLDRGSAPDATSYERKRLIMAQMLRWRLDI